MLTEELKIESATQTKKKIIGGTTYIVTTHYSENARETAEDKLVRIVSDRILMEIKDPINGGIAIN